MIPVLDLEGGEYDVAVSRLSGSILISQESIDDTDYPVTSQVEQVIRDKFSNRLERDFIGGAGPHPTPTGILSVATETTGADLELAAVGGEGRDRHGRGRGRQHRHEPDADRRAGVGPRHPRPGAVPGREHHLRRAGHRPVGRLYAGRSCMTRRGCGS